ncbi:tRNA1(Val) (adenine(37)-N6)-methyltransferase [Spirosoma jeollabukense]
MFRFKQFTIHQDRTAMKVCTDACVLGAYANVVDSPVCILDIGTGTGLLALMAAQRNPKALIDAVEVDDAAFSQVTDNVVASPFLERIRVIHSRIQDFQPTSFLSESKTYDQILTNPPFYTNHLRSPDAAVNRALHTDDLPFPELIESVIRLLKPEGEWWVLLPPYEAQKLADLAERSGLRPFRRLSLRHNARKPIFRIIIGFSFGADTAVDETLNIHEEDGRTYTAEFQTLLRDFYLIF